MPFQLITGYLKLSLHGPDCVRFFNICMFHHIMLLKLTRTKSGYTAFVRIRDFQKLFELRNKADIRMKILRIGGLQAFLRKNRSRKFSLLCGTLCFAGLYVLSLFTWDISFQGNILVTEDELRSFVYECGYREGMRSDAISCEELEKQIRNHFDEVTWVSAQKLGSRLIIAVNENERMDTKLLEKEPCDLIAEKGGEIVKMMISAGRACVSQGDTVEAGTVLVSGNCPIVDEYGEETGSFQVHADALVKIQYRENYYESLPVTVLERVYGSSRMQYGLQIGGVYIGAPRESPKDGVDVVRSGWKVRLFEHLYLPIEVCQSEEKNYKELRKKRTDQELFQLANEHLEAYEEELLKIGVEIIENNVRIERKGDVCLAQGEFCLEETIGETVPVNYKTQEETQESDEYR